MKPSKLTTILLMIALSGISIYWPRRLQIQAAVWHWRHGYSVRAGAFEVPVPEGWLVRTDMSNSMAVVIMNTAPRKPPADTILILTLMSPLKDLESWKRNRSQQFERNGQSNVEAKAFESKDNHEVACVGGSAALLVGSAQPTNLMSMECIWGGQLSLIFAGHRTGLDDFYGVASQIKKAN
jgi:hypothetical protein